jgi:predicted ester cyclase
LEENKKAFRRLIEEGFNKGNLTVVDELVASNFKEHQRGGSEGPPSVKDLIRGIRETIPDVALTIEDMVAEGDMVWARMTARGANTGHMMGRPLRGKSITMDVIGICRFREARWLRIGVFRTN